MYTTSITKYWRKKTMRSSQDSNLGPLNSSQMLLSMSYWSSGIGAEDRWHLSIDTVTQCDSQAGSLLGLGNSAWWVLKYFVLPPANWVNSSSYSVCAVRTLIYRGRPETFLLQKKSAYASFRLCFGYWYLVWLELNVFFYHHSTHFN